METRNLYRDNKRVVEAAFHNGELLYTVIFQSRKESAERFTDWVAGEVLPSIRKTGSYQKQLSPQEMMRIQLGMIDDHEDRIKSLESNMVIETTVNSKHCDSTSIRQF